MGDYQEVKTAGQRKRERHENIGMQKALAQLGLANGNALQPLLQPPPATMQQLAPANNLAIALQLLGGAVNLNRLPNGRKPRSNPATRVRQQGQQQQSTPPVDVSTLPICGYCDMCNTPHRNPNKRTCRTGCGGTVKLIAESKLPAKKGNQGNQPQQAPSNPPTPKGTDPTPPAKATEPIPKGIIKPRAVTWADLDDEDAAMDVDDATEDSNKKLCTPNAKLLRNLKAVQVHIADTKSGADIGQSDFGDGPLTDEVSSLEKQLAACDQSNGPVVALLKSQLEVAKSAQQKAADTAKPLTPTLLQQYDLDLTKYHNWASAKLASKITSLDEEIAKLQSQRLATETEQADLETFLADPRALVKKAEAVLVPKPAGDNSLTTELQADLATLAPHLQNEFVDKLKSDGHDVSKLGADFVALLVEAMTFGHGKTSTAVVQKLATLNPIATAPVVTVEPTERDLALITETPAVPAAAAPVVGTVANDGGKTA